MNYTRDFPTTGTTTYNVYARMAHGDSTQQRGGILMTVQGDTTKCASTDQTTTELGRFAAPWTGGWDSWPDAGTPQDALIQMKDAGGNAAVVKLTGHTTLRFQYALGAGDFDYLAFIPVKVSGLPPIVASAFPAPGAAGLGSAAAFNATINNQDLKVVSASLTLDGASVPATVNITATGATISYTPTTAFAAGSAHTYVLSYTDNDTPAVTRTASVPFTVSFSPFPNGTLFIEAEDFNFGHGQYDKTNPIGMTGPYNGGTYQDKGDGLFAPDGVTPGSDCDGSDFGIDYHDNNSTSDQAVYRPNTPVEAGKRNGPAGLNRQLFSVQINHNLGWTDASEWMNYTRDFPTTGTGTYKVMARMAHGDSTQTRGGILMTVQGDTTLCASTDQTTTELGRFAAPWTGGWDTWPDAGTPQDALIMMKDASGADAIVKLTGHTTIRFQYDQGAGDFDYLAFLPQNISALPVKVVSIAPADASFGASVLPLFTAVLQDQDLTVTGATLKLNGTSVTPTITKSGNQTTVSFRPTTAVAPGSQNVYELTFTDSGGGSTVKTQTFHATFTPLPAGTLFIEAEDFNFGHGQYDTVNPIGMTGAYPGGTYQGKGDGLNGAACDGSDFGIDYNDNNNTSDQAVYRPNTPVEAGKRNGPAGFNRGTFDVQINHNLGWTDSSEWMNYTRDFPATPTAYKVYARMAHGDGTAGVLRGGVLFSVQGDTTACADTAQTTTQLGQFSAPWTGGWDSWPDAGTPQDALIPMTDANGAPATVTLGGKTTLRFQYANNAGDFDYIAFVPATVGPPKPQFTKTTLNNNGSITVEWTGGGVLQTTPAIAPNGTWTDVTGATSPFTFTPQAGVPMLFGRVKQPAP
jgi:hypothetical protein